MLITVSVMLIDTIRADMTAAMKARDEVKLRTLRAVIAAVQEAEVSGSEATSLDDKGVEKVIKAQSKRRQEAADAFQEADRPERVEAELAEKAVLDSYLPEALSDDEVVAIVESTLSENGFTAKDQMGSAMKAVNQVIAGRADGKVVAGLVKERLS